MHRGKLYGFLLDQFSQKNGSTTFYMNDLKFLQRFKPYATNDALQLQTSFKRKATAFHVHSSLVSWLGVLAEIN